MLNQKHLEQHIRGWKHKRVLESWSMNAHRESYHRDNPRHHEYPSGRSRVVIQEPTRVNRQLKEGHPSHWNNRVHRYCGPDYCGPGPDCDSQNDNREPPDDPAETGLYGMYTNQVPSHELNLITKLVHEGRDDTPRVIDITPNCGKEDPTPSTDELVRRLGDGWKELKEG